ncbi:ABC transporter permease [Candidatus Entotheonella palauensis]|uniref:ABC transporter permease n=1 Tax=Candidatus Entotheonella palauensis TaxID=93172 RepID=UPI000B7EE203|nr:ABC transporter permease [Candidatus Entotheonella palauensis]
MTRFILNRAFYSLITLWLLVTIVFGFVRLTGDPSTMLEEVGDEAYVAQLREQWGLDRPYYVQYGKYMWGLLQGDFGNSFQKSLAVRDIYFERLPNSLKLGIAAFIISIALGVPLGILSAMKVQTWWDNFGKVFALLGLSVPNFFIGLMLIVFFGVYLGWLPILGKGDSFWDWQHLIMPAFALGWYFSGSMVRISRSSMLEVMGSDYIKLVRLKGAPEWVVMAKHALKNAMIPIVTLAGLNLVIMVNVAIAIEVVFNWPGVGQLLFDGMSNRDFPMVQGVVLMGGMMIVLLNFMIDILYAYVDPRIRLSR